MNEGHENLFFPPGTCLDIRVNIKPNKIQQLFQGAHLPAKAKYLVHQAAPSELTNIDLTVQDVTLAYESNIMDEALHIQTMNDFKRGYTGHYNFDVVYPFHQSLVGNQSFTRNEFQIPPYARMIAVMYLNDHALFDTPSQKKPTSGFSVFPSNCTNLSVKFNGTALVCDQFQNLGIANNHTEVSKQILFDYLLQSRLYSGSFSSYFPVDEAISINQVLIFDIENLLTGLTSILSLEAFYNSTKSPENLQILVFSIHGTGKGEVKLLNKIDQNYEWKFYTIEQ